MLKLTKSNQDESYAKLLKFLEKNRIYLKGYSESDTRSKFIDPIFKDILGWSEHDIRREQPAADGYSDYVVGAEYSFFHIEAKRALPQFEINAPSKARQLKLEGPHLLGKKSVKPHLEQVAKYSIDLGTDFAILTNGNQYVIFKTRIPGRSWRTGDAIVFHDWDDIKANFTDFYGLLSKEQVRSGALSEAFDLAQKNQAMHYTALQYVHSPDSELIRNKFWNKISHIINPYLTVDPSDVEIQDEIIQHCYVNTPISDEVDRSINQLLSRGLPQFLKEAGTKDIGLDNLGHTAFDHNIENDIKLKKMGTYILTGGVGSGKTTFLRRFARHAAAVMINHYCIWNHVDYLSFGDGESDESSSNIRSFTYKKILENIEKNYPKLWPSSGEQLRKLFSDKIEKAKLTILFGISPGSKEWQEIENQIIQKAFESSEDLIKAIMVSAQKNGLRTVIVLDNTDQLGERIQESVFLLAQKLSSEFQALTIVSLREEKFFAAFRRGLFDAYGDKRFHIGSPSLGKVLEKRLLYANGKLEKYQSLHEGSKDEYEKLILLVNIIIKSTTIRNQNIVRFLSCISNGDMRFALNLFKEFISSGNTNVEKILKIYNEHKGYTVPFHEFAKSTILSQRRYYKNSNSHVLNLFNKSTASTSSWFTAPRILSRLSSAASSPSSFGEGYVSTALLLREFRESFGSAEDFLLRGDELLMRGLIESEPPRSISISETEALHISAAGEYYWKYLIRSFAYLDLIYIDTPLPQIQLAQRLADLSSDVDMQSRFTRVGEFLAFLAKQEADELLAKIKHGTYYSFNIIPDIINQIEREIKHIKSKL